VDLVTKYDVIAITFGKLLVEIESLNLINKSIFIKIFFGCGDVDQWPTLQVSYSKQKQPNRNSGVELQFRLRLMAWNQIKKRLRG
jgi:hypothetical protein